MENKVYFSNESEQIINSNAPTTLLEKPKTEMSMEDQLIDNQNISKTRKRITKYQ